MAARLTGARKRLSWAEPGKRWYISASAGPKRQTQRPDAGSALPGLQPSALPVPTSNPNGYTGRTPPHDAASTRRLPLSRVSLNGSGSAPLCRWPRLGSRGTDKGISQDVRVSGHASYEEGLLARLERTSGEDPVGVWHRRTAAAEAPNPAYSRIVGGPRDRLTKALTLERLKGLAWEP